MLSRVISAGVLGIEAYLVRVEADVANGLPNFATVGLPQGAVKEGKERVIAALKNSGFQLPSKRITINLSPADIPKKGSAFDLPIAIGILAGTGQVSEGRLKEFVLLGELGLDGALRRIRGVLPIAVGVRAAGFRGIILPIGNVREASVVAGLEVRGARDLRQVTDFFDGRCDLPVAPSLDGGFAPLRPDDDVDFADVRGQDHVKRALEVAAAGAHNILMTGPPGSGKTMLARRLPGVLPPLTLDEAIETSKVHSVAGLLTSRSPLVPGRPFRAPHHTISDAGLIGGGSNPRPGEASLAHNGVLFLDELPEFRRHVLEALRQPLVEHQLTIARAGLSLTYPARFMLVAAMNPCPCGHSGDSRRACTCAPALIRRYLTRVSGPLLDRIDLHVDVPGLAETDLVSERSAEPSASVRERVVAARDRQRERLGTAARANAHMTPREIRAFCTLDGRGEGLLKSAVSRLGLSARGYHGVLKIARTIADLERLNGIGAAHVAEAIQYRSMDRPVLADTGGGERSRNMW